MQKKPWIDDKGKTRYKYKAICFKCKDVRWISYIPQLKNLCRPCAHLEMHKKDPSIKKEKAKKMSKPKAPKKFKQPRIEPEIIDVDEINSTMIDEWLETNQPSIMIVDKPMPHLSTHKRSIT